MASTKENFNYGGQAVIEGVLMRGSKGLSVAVRNPQDEIIIHTEPLNPRIYGGLSKIPFLRGLVLLWDALGLGTKALMFSAEVALEEEEDEAASETVDETVDGDGEPAGANKVFEGPLQWGTMFLSLGFSVFLFMLLPAFLADLIPKGLFAIGLVDWREGQIGELAFNLLTNGTEGLVRLTLVVSYIWAIGLLPDIKRLYGYHGAEHKTINAYEAGAELTPANVAKYPIEHPRCGTAFLLTVVMTSILFFSVMTVFFPILLQIWWRVLSRLVFLPVVSGIAYEFIRFTAKYQTNPIIRLIIIPNLALQRLTTREPDEGMLEVAIAAFNEVLNLEYNSVEAADSISTMTPASVTTNHS